MQRSLTAIAPPGIDPDGRPRTLLGALAPVASLLPTSRLADPSRPGSGIGASSMPADSSGATSVTALSRSSSPRSWDPSPAAAAACMRAARAAAVDGARGREEERSAGRGRGHAVRGPTGARPCIVGNMTSAGRAEVTALGDEVNEAGSHRGVRYGRSHQLAPRASSNVWAPMTRRRSTSSPTTSPSRTSRQRRRRLVLRRCPPLLSASI